MHTEGAELSSITTALRELTARVTAMADRFTTSVDEGIGTELYDVERSLVAAQRRLDRVGDALA